MALIDKLNAIGEAIRAKTGKTDKLMLDQMPNEIASIEGGGTTPANPIIEALSVTENGTYTAPNGVDGYSPVTVNVPVPEGYIKPNGTLKVTKNGTHDVAEYASVNVNVPTEGGGDGESEDLDAVLIEQETLIAELQDILSHKMSGSASDLPDGYYQVDFIEFNGKQLVDTGLIGNQDTKIRTSFTWGSATQNHVFGCASPDNTASITSYMNGSWRFGSKSITKNVTKNINTPPYSAYVDKTTIGITGSVTAISDVADFETINTLLVGGARNSIGELPSSGIIGRIFNFILWNGDTLVMKLVPVSNGTKYRFWDEVTKVFFDSITDTPLEGGNL